MAGSDLRLYTDHKHLRQTSPHTTRPRSPPSAIDPTGSRQADTQPRWRFLFHCLGRRRPPPPRGCGARTGIVAQTTYFPMGIHARQLRARLSPMPIPMAIVAQPTRNMPELHSKHMLRGGQLQRSICLPPPCLSLADTAHIELGNWMHCQIVGWDPHSERPAAFIVARPAGQEFSSRDEHQFCASLGLSVSVCIPTFY